MRARGKGAEKTRTSHRTPRGSTRSASAIQSAHLCLTLMQSRDSRSRYSTYQRRHLHSRHSCARRLETEKTGTPRTHEHESGRERRNRISLLATLDVSSDSDSSAAAPLDAALALQFPFFVVAQFSPPVSRNTPHGLPVSTAVILVLLSLLVCLSVSQVFSIFDSCPCSR